MPLATIVRLPALTDLRCPVNPDLSCLLSGSALYLIDAVATDNNLTLPTNVPEGFVEPSLAIPHPVGTSFYLTLRDDPTSVDTVTMPIKRTLPATETAPVSDAEPARTPASSTHSSASKPSAPHTPSVPN